MKQFLFILFALLSFAGYTQSIEFDKPFSKDTSYVRYGGHLYFNAVSALSLRPRIEYEHFLKPRKSIAVEAGAIIPFKAWQNVQAKSFHTDGFLFNGYYLSSTLKFYKHHTPHQFIAVKVYYKDMWYNNQVYDNMYKDTLEHWVHEVSSIKRQIGVSGILGSRKLLKGNMLIEYYYGAGLFYSQAERVHHRKIEDETYFFILEDTPFTKTSTIASPWLHWGIRIGLGVKPQEFDNLKFK